LEEGNALLALVVLQVGCEGDDVHEFAKETAANRDFLGIQTAESSP